MDKLKKAIVAVLIIIVLLFIIICCIYLAEINKQNGENEFDGSISDVPYDDAFYEELDTEVITDEDLAIIDLYKIKRIISTYFANVNKNNSAYFARGEDGTMEKFVDDETIKKSIYDILSEDYIKENNINTNNVYEFVDNIEEDMVYDILKIEKENQNQYLVYGILQTLDNKFVKKEYFIVNINDSENCFSIQPIIKGSVNINDIKNTQKAVVTKNENNEIPSVNFLEESVCLEYMRTYKRLLLVAPEEAYNMLDENYKKSKFSNLQEFEEYINENKSRILTITIDKFNIYNLDDNTTQYVCIDKNGYYYIINEKSVLDYTIMLDSYTIDVEESKANYQSATNENKVAMNAEKIKQAINSKDYKYVYNKLNSTFKDSNFQNYNDFIVYIKSVLFDNNNFEYTDIQEQGGVYQLKITVTDKSNKSTEIKYLTIVMRLNGDTDFEMSFNI